MLVAMPSRLQQFQVYKGGSEGVVAATRGVAAEFSKFCLTCSIFPIFPIPNFPTSTLTAKRYLLSSVRLH